jgi:arylsulfatase A-like enzyme
VHDTGANATEQATWNAAFSQATQGGPTQHGFDYYFGVDVPNWPPYCFIENERTVGIPSTWLPNDVIGNNQASMSGPAMPEWNFEQLLPTWGQKAEEYIADRAENDAPFFLYMALTSPHTPLAVNKEFIGASGLNNRYADLVIETDAILGRVLDALDAHGLCENTLVIFTSDNGCAPYVHVHHDGSGPGTAALEPQGHFPSGPYRGYKSDAWDGGHRVPFIARWPQSIAPASTCEALVSLVDFMATCADILGDPLPDHAGEDSVSLLPLFNQRQPLTRDALIHHSIDGKFAIRTEQWKLILCPGSGGWTLRDHVAAAEGLPLVQLYDMTSDPGEQHNLQAQHPDIVQHLLTQLRTLIAKGRSTPGRERNNDVPIDLWKSHTTPAVPPAAYAALDDY